MKNTLEAKRAKEGWITGDIDELLGLSPEEIAFVEMKINLSKKLHFQRKSHKLTQVQAAKILRTSQSRFARMERCDPSVSIDLLIRSLIALGATRKVVARTIAA